MNIRIMPIVLSLAVCLTATLTLRYDTVIADRIEEVTGEDTDDADPEVELVEEVIDEDYDIAGVVINEMNFPDAEFRNYVSNYCDTDGNGKLSSSEITSTTSITIFPEIYQILQVFLILQPLIASFAPATN